MNNKINNTTINLSEIQKNSGFNIDPMGFLFKYKGRLFRAINNAKTDEVLFLFKSGAIDELNEAKLIPYTKISDMKLEGYNLLIEHEKIDVVTFSCEWSFEMLKEAALLIIDVNKILFKYGYETKDAHSHNVVFDKCNPKYVDLGSFHRRKNKKYWECKDEFYKTYLYPMKIWSAGNSQIARKSITDAAGFLYRHEYTLYKYSIMRFIPLKFITTISYFLEVLRNLSKFDLDKMYIAKNADMKRKMLKILHKITLLGLLPHNSVNLETLKRKIKKIKRPVSKTKWGSYHTNVDTVELFQKGGRFDLVISLLKKYNINEVFEIGGNHGLLSIEIGKFVERVICSDYDELAVDNMFVKAKSQKANITPVLLNIINPIYLSTFYSEQLTPKVRFRSQATLALALTHHLLLDQRTPVDQMFKVIVSYTKEYAFIEFMPNGIGKPPLPNWYNIDWFREKFIQYFDLILETPSVPDGNRILFFGKVKN